MLHGSDTDTFLYDILLVFLVAEAPDIASGRIVSHQQVTVYHDSGTKTGTECYTEQIFITLNASRLFQTKIYLRQCAGKRFAISKKVAVIIDEDRDAELFFQVRAQRYASAERRKVRQITDNTGRIISWSGKSKTDGNRGFRQLFANPGKTCGQLPQALFQITGTRGQRYRSHYLISPTDSRKDQVGPSGIKGHYYAVIVIHYIYVCLIDIRLLSFRPYISLDRSAGFSF